jgi:hypothetical protein
VILILSGCSDPHVAFVCDRLERIRAPFAWVNPADFPARMTLSFERGTGARRSSLTLGDRTIHLHGIRSVWWRRPDSPEAPRWITDAEQRSNIAELSGVGLGGVWESLDCLWVPGKPTSRIRANFKLSQLALAQRVGFAIPRTLVTNDPGRLLAFYAEHRGRIVTKAVSPLLTVGGQRAPAATEWVSRRRLRRVHTVRHEPVIAQRFVDKALELRVTVVGDQAFGAAIRSGAVPRARVDWRAAQDLLAWEPHKLPRSVADRCVSLTHRMGLTFGAIDLIVTPAGRHVFLEINPAGQWGFMPGVSADIADALVSLLVKGNSRQGNTSRD